MSEKRMVQTGFTGEFRRELDEKFRFILPSKIREQSRLVDGGDENFFVTRGFDRNLYLFTPSQWSRFSEPIGAGSVADPKIRALQRLFFGNSFDAAPDRQGRLLIPRPLRAGFAAGGEVVLVGAWSRIEIFERRDYESRAGIEFEEYGSLIEMLDKKTE